MAQLDITKAKAELSKLLDLAIKGEEIVITQDDHQWLKYHQFNDP